MFAYTDGERKRGLCTAVIALALAGLWWIPARGAAEGVTIVIHGWNVTSSEPAWTSAMQTAIANARLGGESRLGTITVTGSLGNLTAACSPWDFDLTTGSAKGEFVVRVDWSAVANHLTSYVTAQEVAAVIAPRILSGQNGKRALAELPIHLIGHSRGGGMVCEIARLLGEAGVEVAQVTPLDAHPLTSGDQQPNPLIHAPIIDTPVALYENVLFADGYWQDITAPKGQYISGAYNRLWTSLPGGYHNHANAAYRSFADHLNILLLYQGSIDLATPVSNGEATMDVAERGWFNAYESDGGTSGSRACFYYSRIIGKSNLRSTDTPGGGGDRIVDGLHDDASIGGAGARSALGWASAVWPNVLTLEVKRSGSILGGATETVALGETLDVAYTYRDKNNPSTVTLFLDADRNPYNGNELDETGTAGHAATGVNIVSASLPWDTATAPASGSFYLGARVEDGTRQRFIYAIPSFVAQTVQLTVASLSPGSGVLIAVSPDDVNGHGAGSTQFTRIYNDETTVTLTAPQAASNGALFLKWLIDGRDFAGNGSRTVQVLLNANGTMTAVYHSDYPTLSVASQNPDSGVSISLYPADRAGKTNGVTLFSCQYGWTSLVTLTAPAAAANGYIFSKWLKDGADFPNNAQRAVRCSMDTDHTMTVVYAHPANTSLMTVASSNPGSGVNIAVYPADRYNRTAGTTQFVYAYAPWTLATLTAPAVAPNGYVFSKWLKDGADFANNTQRAVQCSLGGDHTMTAIYVHPANTWLLTVASSNPDSGVTIAVYPVDKNGRSAGATQFVSPYAPTTLVTLTAPATAPNGYHFVKWQRDGGDFGNNTERAVLCSMGADHTMTAVYNP